MANRGTVVLIGSESLVAREIRDIVAGPPGAGLDLRLIAADDEPAGALTRVGDELTVVIELNPENLTGARAVILAGSPASSRKALDLLRDNSAAMPDNNPAVIDLAYTAEERPDARLRAPLVESEPEDLPDAADVHVIAHPAAIALALFLRRLHAQDAIRRSVIQIFAPASEHGAPGIEELQQQTVSLLSFKPMPRAVFDAQVSFNMLARYGEEAPASLEESELRIERHLATLLAMPGQGEGAPMPSLRLIQAPVFHGYSFSAWVEFEVNPGVEALESGLPMGSIEVRGADFDPPTNLSQAGQGGITVGAITPDRNHSEACWFWFVADNLRLAAENAVAVARQLI
ncbi:MAG TPA: Asd/ArgC dimerization domain-containing protein [Candidatus Solibacter sp.]|nr:Asd/ArgC dimerization domain-containing protein [Candidatus Solibacter sp.]